MNTIYNSLRTPTQETTQGLIIYAYSKQRSTVKLKISSTASSACSENPSVLTGITQESTRAFKQAQEHLNLIENYEKDIELQ